MFVVRRKLANIYLNNSEFKLHLVRIVITLIYIIAAIVLLFSLAYGSILWSIVSSIPFLFLLWQVFFSGPEDPIIEKITGNNFEKLKVNSEKIVVDFDHCEFKDSSFTNEVIDRNMDSLGYGEIKRKDFILQSLLIYHPDRNTTEKFIQAFHCSADTLKVYVLKNEVTLYIDRRDRSHYLFELKTQ